MHRLLPADFSSLGPGRAKRGRFDAGHAIILDFYGTVLPGSAAARDGHSLIFYPTYCLKGTVLNFTALEAGNSSPTVGRT